MKRSNCCDAIVYDDCDICSDCFEHCEPIEEEEEPTIGEHWLVSMFGNVKDELEKALDISGKKIYNNGRRIK